MEQRREAKKKKKKKKKNAESAHCNVKVAESVYSSVRGGGGVMGGIRSILCLFGTIPSGIIFVH